MTSSNSSTIGSILALGNCSGLLQQAGLPRAPLSVEAEGYAIVVAELDGGRPALFIVGDDSCEGGGSNSTSPTRNGPCRTGGLAVTDSASPH